MDAFVDIDIAELELLMEQQGLAPEATPYGDDAMFTPELFLSRSGYDAYTNNFDALEEAWLNLQVTTDTNTSKINDKPLFNEDGFGITILDVHSNALGTAIIDNVSEFFDNPTNGLWFAHFASVIQLEYDEIIENFLAVIEESDPLASDSVLDEDDICAILQAEFVLAGGIGGAPFAGAGALVGGFVGAIYWELVDQEFDCD